MLVTTAHVLSPDAGVADALRPTVTSVVRSAAGSGQTTHRVTQVLFTSPPGALDVTIAELDPPIVDAPELTIAATVDLRARQRVVLVGHSGGKELALTFGKMVACNESVLLHRCATTGETSGSPIFDDEWRLLAMHHATRSPSELTWTDIPGTGEVNEAIQIAAITKELGRAFDTEQPAGRRRLRRDMFLFVSYSRRDEELKEQFVEQLSRGLQGIRSTIAWRDVDRDTDDDLTAFLRKVDIVLVLVSPDYVDSDYIHSTQLSGVFAELMTRDQPSRRRVIPVIVRDVERRRTIFERLQTLPLNGTPVTAWSNRDAAWANVVEGVNAVIDRLPSDEPEPSW